MASASMAARSSSGGANAESEDGGGCGTTATPAAAAAHMGAAAVAVRAATVGEAAGLRQRESYAIGTATTVASTSNGGGDRVANGDRANEHHLYGERDFPLLSSNPSTIAFECATIAVHFQI